MEYILRELKQLQKSDIRSVVDSRLKEFQAAGKKSSNEIFGELCFCLMTANFTAERSIKIQNQIGSGFCSMSQKELSEQLKQLGHRFPNARAKYIFEAQKHSSSIKDTLNSIVDETAIREWLVQNIKGLGMKEASHFLRNVGYENLAIIDFHIIDKLVKHGLIDRPKSLTKRTYLEIESVLRKLADKAGMSLAELDLYLWYAETGKVLK